MQAMLVDQVKPQSRVGRYPTHDFNIRSLPFVAQPFMIAPLMVGETVKNIYLESRVVSQPILNPIVGWKQTYYFYKVRMTDLLLDAARDMFIDPTNTDISATLGVAANDQQFYTAKGSLDYARLAYRKVIEHYMRDQDELWSDYQTADGRAIVQFRKDMFLDSLTDKDKMPEGAAISTAIDAGDLERLMTAFEQLRAMGIANMTYEDWLRTNGINIPTKDENKPEFLASFSDWTYPTNTIDPANGTPRSAVSFVFKEGKRGRWFCKEPSFLIGISVARPKIYFSGLAGNAAGFLSRAWDWSPNYLYASPETSLKNFAGDTGPLGDRTTAPDGYWLDMRDIFLYGDQWQNHTPFNVVPADVPAEHMIALPDGATFKWKYPTEAQCKAFFVDAVNNAYIRQDGVVSLSVDGHMVDHTVGQLAEQ